jgi:hypothetical protein
MVADEDDLVIPEFLKIPAEERKKQWEDNPPEAIRSRFMSEDKMRTLREEYEQLGKQMLELGGTFRPISGFPNEHEAELAIERLKSSVKAREKANAEMEKQDDGDGNGAIIETTEEKENDNMTITQTHSSGAKGSKKTAAKKAAPKTAAKKVAPKKVAKKNGGTGKFAPEAKIHMLTKENPRRPGSEVFKHFERAQKANTVADYVKAGGSVASLAKCVSKGWCKVG